MKKTLLLAAACASLSMAGAQTTIKNGNFENWNSVSFDQPDGWKTARDENPEAASVTKTTDGHTGSAIKLETVDFKGEAQFGFFTNSGGNPIEGEGGEPYSQKPTTISGYYKCNIVEGDSAIFLVIFKKQGAILDMKLIKFAGTKTSFTQFSLPLNLSATPDSVVIAAASGNVEEGDNPPVGSTITFDDITLSGTGITQQLSNGTFENWTPTTKYGMVDWWTFDRSTATRTTDKYKGAAALQIMTYQGQEGPVRGGNVMLGKPEENNFNPVFVPYNKADDSLVFWYKFTSVSNDSANVNIMLKKGNNPLNSIWENIDPAAQYTRKAIRINPSEAPDSIFLSIGLATSQPMAHIGSLLVIDEVTLASEPLNTGVKEWGRTQNSFRFYPNPCNEVLFMETTDKNLVNEPINYRVNDITGKTLGSGMIINNEINISELSRGIYFITISNLKETLSVKKIIKE